MFVGGMDEQHISLVRWRPAGPLSRARQGSGGRVPPPARDRIVHYRLLRVAQKFVIKVNGSQHLDQQEYDAARTAYPRSDPGVPARVNKEKRCLRGEFGLYW
jgi:hypothetical protein